MRLGIAVKASNEGEGAIVNSRIRKVAVLLCFGLFLASCAAPLPIAFDADSASNIVKPGNNTIEGTAFTASPSGYVRNCSRGDVFLVPKTRYAQMWFAQAFQGRSYAYRIAVDQMPANEGFEKYRREGECDKEGRFRFEQVADGDYYVFVRIFWLLRWQRNGYALMAPVAVSHGMTTNMALEHREVLGNSEASAPGPP
jgi:hypothetical protein